MKQVVTTILSLIILFSASPLALTYWMWRVNQGDIAKTLSIKKDEVGNTCQGKCHLKVSY